MRRDLFLGFNMSMEDKKATILSIISDHFGQEIAKMYENYYAKKEFPEMIESVKELLSEAIGEKAADKKIKSLIE